ncbi:hypothetical protein RYR54_000072 [Aeromonas sobria]|nr:hypothetical protein [Aeromonas sobria]
MKRDSEQKNAVDFCYPCPFLASHAPPYSLAIYSSKVSRQNRHAMNATPSPEPSPDEVINTLSREQCRTTRPLR